MIREMVKRGTVIGEHVPAPMVSKGSVLIKVVSSCISAGTEIGSIQARGELLIKKEMAQPVKIAKGFDSVRSQGTILAFQQITGKLESGKPTGYSVAGVVLAVGEGVTRFVAGDRVTASGAAYATHAEIVDVPQNLVVRIPAGCWN